MIRQFLDLPPFAFITVIVQAQLAVTMVMAVVIALMLARRTRRQRWAEACHQRFAELLILEMMEVLEGGPAKRHIARPRWPSERRVLKATMLEQLRTVSGSEREFLIHRYDELGFVAADRAQLRSRLWWRRLAAASDLALLEARRFADDFHRLSKDRHELVSAFGHYALSGLKHDINRPFPVRSFPPSVQSRLNLMTEILRNWARVRGPATLTAQMAHVREPRLLEALVTAASSTLSAETAVAFAEQLTSGQTFAPGLLERMIASLTKVGDPQYADAVRPYVTHANEIVRLRALEYLVAMGEDEVLSTESVNADPAVAVRRAVARWRAVREAA